ncbi:MAG: hypothetical protein ACMZ7B_08630 [Balneola sp.]
MKKKIRREELIEIRKRKQSEKEMEFELGRDLKLNDQLQDAEERNFAGKNRFVIAAINFFGTLTILWIPYMIANKILPFGGPINNVIKAVILTISIISAFRRKSLIENWF